MHCPPLSRPHSCTICTLSPAPPPATRLQDRHIIPPIAPHLPSPCTCTPPLSLHTHLLTVFIPHPVRASPSYARTARSCKSRPTRPSRGTHLPSPLPREPLPSQPRRPLTLTSRRHNLVARRCVEDWPAQGHVESGEIAHEVRIVRLRHILAWYVLRAAPHASLTSLACRRDHRFLQNVCFESAHAAQRRALTVAGSRQHTEPRT